MNITGITIHNFRSIADATVRLGDYTLLVGENNVGKSNVIDALRVFYEKGLKYDPKRDVPKFETAEAESWIDIEFTLADDEYDNLKEEYRLPGKALKVRKFLRTTQKGTDGKPLAGIHAFTGDSGIADEQFYGAKNVQQGKLGDVIYIEDVSRLSEHTKLSGPSALRDLIDDIVKKLVRSSASFEKLTRQFQEFAGAFKGEETADGASLTKLETDINAEIASWDTSFRLNISAPSEGQIVKNLVSHAIHDEVLQSEMAPEQFGQGLQRVLIFTLIRLAAQYQPQPTPTDKKEFAPQMTLLLFEEPEAFLHPQQQVELATNLRTIGGRETDQVLISSHSPYYVSNSIDDIPSIARLSKAKGTTVVGQISTEKLAAIFAENIQINELVKGTKYEASADDFKEDMEAIKYCLWLNPERCGMFFARHVLLVEGATERAVINYLLATGQARCPRGGVFVLDCMGKFNIHRFMNILAPLNVPHAVLFDADGVGRPHDEIKKLITESATGLTTKVDTFPNDLETFLGLTERVRADRKPQHMMLRLKENAIGEDPVAALIGKINGLVPAEGE